MTWVGGPGGFSKAPGLDRYRSDSTVVDTASMEVRPAASAKVYRGAYIPECSACSETEENDN